MTVPNSLLPPVRVEDTGLGRYQVKVATPGAEFFADEPVTVGGLGSGPTPYDLLSAAVGACTTMTLKLYATQRAWPLHHVSVKVGHDRDPAQTPADRFTRHITLEGPLDAAQRQRLLEIADRCPVHQTLSRGARFETALSDVDCGSDPSDHMTDMRQACATD